MGSTIQCDIVSAQQMIFTGDVSMLVASGSMGELGVTPRHAPLMTTLKPGLIRLVMPNEEEQTFFVGGGIIEVMPHLVTILADTALRADDIDEAAAIRARDEARRALENRRGEMEIAEALARLAEAMNKLEALEQLRKLSRIRR